MPLVCQSSLNTRCLGAFFRLLLTGLVDRFHNLFRPRGRSTVGLLAFENFSNLRQQQIFNFLQ